MMYNLKITEMKTHVSTFQLKRKTTGNLGALFGPLVDFTTSKPKSNYHPEFCLAFPCGFTTYACTHK